MGDRLIGAMLLVGSLPGPARAAARRAGTGGAGARRSAARTGFGLAAAVIGLAVACSGDASGAARGTYGADYGATGGAAGPGRSSGMHGEGERERADSELGSARARPTVNPYYETTDTYLYSIGAQSAPGVFAWAERIDVADDGNLYLSEPKEHRVEVINPIGGLVTLWGWPGHAPGRLAMTAGLDAESGLVYVADAGNFRVEKYTRLGERLDELDGYPDAEHPGRQRSWMPHDVAIGDADRVYVADGYDSRVLAFRSNGQFDVYWGGPGTDDGRFVGIAGLDVGSDGSVFVAERGGSGRVQRFTADGERIGGWTVEPMRDIAVSAGTVWVVGGDRFGLRWFDYDGLEMGEVPLAPPGSDLMTELRAPVSVAVAPEGQVYVLDVDAPAGGADGRARILQYSVSGAYVGVLSGGRPSDGMIDPVAVEYPTDRRLRVADRANGRVQVFEPDGRHLATWGDETRESESVDDPVGITTYALYGTYVSDRGRRKVIELDADGNVVREMGTGTGTALGEFSEWGPAEVEASHELAPQNQFVWAADPGNTRVQAFGIDGVPRLAVGAVGFGDGQFPEGSIGHLATSPRGELYVTEQSAAQRVVQFDWQGKFMRSFYGRVGEDSRIAPLAGIDYAAPFRLFLSDPRRRIQVFTSSGEYVEEIDTNALHPAVHIQPGDLSAGDDKRLYVADDWNHRVHVLGTEYPAAWRVEWFANAWLTGAPLHVESHDEIDFKWGTGSPQPDLPADDFSGRLTKWVELRAATHRIEVDADGGVRLWIDGGRLAETWDERDLVRVVDEDLSAGWHLLELHYTHDALASDARLKVSIRQVSATFTKTPAPGGRPVTPTYPATMVASPSATWTASETPTGTVLPPPPTVTATGSAPTPSPSPDAVPTVYRSYLPLLERR